MLPLFAKGLLIGLAIAAPVGPIGLLCIQRTLQYGFKIGLFSGLGAALADGMYGLIAGLGLTTLMQFLTRHAEIIHFMGGIFLLYLGGRLLWRPPQTFSSPQPVESSPSLWHSGLSTCLLTLTNPLTIISFMAIFAGLGLGLHHPNYHHALFLVSGIFLGSALWWLLLSSSVAFMLHHRLSARTLKNINLFSGLLLCGFGIASFII